MAKLTPVPFPDLVRRMRREVEVCQSVFDLPAADWFHPTDKLDFSACHLPGRAAAPLGPAAGPHTQMAQNIALSWLAGGRILELKTVQVKDQLEIPRPCIYVPNVGYNVEYSQELAVAQSIREYAKAVYLVEILKSTAGFGASRNPAALAQADTLFDASVGYDLEGLHSEKVALYLRALRDPAAYFAELRGQMTGDLRAFRDIALPAAIASCVTLSTFHGCPASQVEAMASHLLELGFHVVIKFNPTLLGFEPVRELLFDRLGYHHLVLLGQAFEQDLSYDEALEMLRRLHGTAANCGRKVGAKFTNTLVVANDPQFFPTQAEPYMYLSGRPLHVIAMNLMHRFREEVGFDLPVSFSAGIDQKNFAAAAACGMTPVTTCTDLLRQGGYARLPRYLGRLAEVMQTCSVTSFEAYVLAAHGHGAEAAEQALRRHAGGEAAWNRARDQLTRVAGEQPDQFPHALRQVAGSVGLDAEALVEQALRLAGRLNGRDIVPALAGDPRYHATANQSAPRRVQRQLALHDCINCDLCIGACPNDAIFSYDATPIQLPTEILRLCGDRVDRAQGRGFAVLKRHQLAVVQSLCNECSNCEVYCPEQGAPFRLKEQVFLSAEDLRAQPSGDGFCRQDNALLARIDGREMRFEPHPERNLAFVHGRDFWLELQWEPFAVKRARGTGAKPVTLDTAELWRMKTVWESIFHSTRPNMVSPDPLACQEGGAIAP